MSAVSEWIVREYFESLGYFVHQPRKYQVVARSKHPDEVIDLIIYNPTITTTDLSDKIIWTGSDMRKVSKAVVNVCGWHTERFSPKVLETSPEIFRFTDSEVMDNVPVLTDGAPAKILCLPDFPATKSLKNDAITLVKERGVDGVLLFRTMLQELAGSIDVQKMYEKSDLLQILRILKKYDLLKDAQLELFRKKKRRSKASTSS